ncbi:hypothetical protein ANTPLA_LOCUS6733 [Anthophora plagiata]
MEQQEPGSSSSLTRKNPSGKAEGRHIYYLDETWVNAGDCHKKIWMDSTVHSSRDAQKRGLSTGIPEPTGHAIPPVSVKVKLIKMVKQVKPQYKKYVINEYAKKNGKIILRLPPYHYELNPIEMGMGNNKELSDRETRHTKEERFVEIDQIVDEINDRNIVQNSISEEGPQSEYSQADSSDESE